MLASRAVDDYSAIASPARRRLTIFIIHPSDLVTDHRPHGDGTVAWGFIRELARRGHRIHVACERVDLAEPAPLNVTFYPIRTRKPWGTGHMFEYMFRCRLLFERLRRRISFDVAHQLNPVFGGLSLAMIGSGIPVVLGPYVASWPCGWDGGPVVENRIRALLKRSVLYLQQRPAAALLVTTQAALDTRVVENRAIRARVRTQHHGIDAAAYAAPGGTPFEASRSRILFLANIGIRKGIFTLLDAFALVHAVRPHAKLVIGGAGPDLDVVRERVAAAGLGSAVEILGNVPRAAIPALLQESTVFCAPSFGEPYGMSAIEAMAAGLPLVVTNCGGLAEVADSGGALYVQPGDVSALADALLTVLDSPDQARAMGEHNVRRVREVFDWPTVVDALEDTYALVALKGDGVRC